MYGRLALDLLEKLNAKEWKAQIYITPYGLIFHFRTEHVRESASVAGILPDRARNRPD